MTFGFIAARDIARLPVPPSNQRYLSLHYC